MEGRAGGFAVDTTGDAMAVEEFETPIGAADYSGVRPLAR